ncbi:MAG: hypothetical protein DRM99_04275, partial [Thermoplasmata archaeon]
NIMEKLMTLMIMKSMMENKKPEELEALKSYIEKLERKLEQQELLKIIGEKKSESSEFLNFLREQAKMQKETEKEHAKTREQLLIQAINSRIKDLENKLQASGGGFSARDIKYFKDTISTLKDLSKELGGTEKGPGDVAKDIITSTAEKFAPVVHQYLQTKAQQPIIVQAPPQPQQQEYQEQPQEGEYIDLSQPQQVNQEIIETPKYETQNISTVDVSVQESKKNETEQTS